MAPKEMYGNSSIEPDYEKIAKHYGMEYKGGGERISVLKNLEEITEDCSNKLILSGVTFIDISAAKKNKISPLTDLAILCAIHTNDDKILVGVRGRRYGKELTSERVRDMANNCYALVPAGGLTFRFDENPLDYTLKNEAMEELGIFPNEISNKKIISIFKANKIGPLGYKIVEIFKTPLNSKEIIERHKESLNEYFSLCKNLPEKEACKKLKTENKPNDAWEHSEIIPLNMNVSALEKFIEEIPKNENNYLQHRLCGIGIGGLLSVVDYLR